MEPASTDAILPPAGTVFEDRFEILGDLGAGSFGRVLRARQVSTGQLVAIKVLHLRGPEGRDALERSADRFRREMRICAELSHPNVVRLIDSGESADGLLYAAFAHVPGETLADTLAREGTLHVREATRLLAQVLDALACAHASGIVHRDLKPANIMLSGTGGRRNALVLDFGLGGVVEEVRREAWHRLTASREFMGTPFYAAPEQLLGGEPSPRSDLYAWGLIFLECLTGRLPFAEGRSPSPWSDAAAVEVPGWLRGHRLGRLLETVTLREVEKRDVSVDRLLATLEAIESEGLPEPPVAEPRTTDAERRSLTVLSCRISITGKEELPFDVEERDAILREQHLLCAEVASRTGGIVASKLGDRVVLCFGYPQAAEDDATRAARAGLEIAAAVGSRASRIEEERGLVVEAHIGVHTGPVIARGLRGAGGAGGLEVVGATAEVATTLDARARSGEVLASEGVRRLLRGDFRAVAVGEAPLGGSAAPQPVLRIGRGGSETVDLEESRLVGRVRELEDLQEVLRGVKEGAPAQRVLLGDAGIGKSRMLRELRRRAGDCRWIECRCLPENRNAPLQPVIEALASQAASLGSATDTPDGWDAEALELLGLLRAEAHETDSPRSRELEKDRTLSRLARGLFAVAEREPTILVVEDLHWADPTTLELLGRIVQEVEATEALEDRRGVRLFVLFTLRTEAPRPPFTSAMSTLHLPRLSRGEVATMIRAQLGDRPRLDEDALERIASRADGVPLFVEELGRVLAHRLREGEGRADDLPEMPGTVRALLTARLDTLSYDAFETVQLAATLGREFRLGLLRAVSPKDGAMLRADVDELVRVGLVLPRRSTRHESFVFKHALLRDAAYESMLRPARREWHGRTAEALQREFPELCRERPELLAHHLSAAESPDEAVTWWKRAAERAMARSAYEEAIRHCEAALEELERLPAGRERDRRELELREALGTSLFSTRGYAVPEVVEAFGRARELCERLGDATPLRVLWGTWGVQIVRSDRVGTAELVPHFLQLVEQSRDPVALVASHAAVATYALYRAEFRRALEHAEQATRWYPSNAFQAFLRDYGYDVGMYAFATVMVCHFILGEPDAAQEAFGRMLARAEEAGNPYGIAIALGYGMNHAREMRAFPEALELADRQLAFASEQRLTYWLGPAQCTRGWARAHLGEDGAEEIRAGLALCRAVGLRSTYPYLLAGLADVHRLAADPEPGLEAVREGLELCDTLLDRFHEADLLRLEGELLAARGDREAAVERLGRALALARRQGANAYALRAAAARARLDDSHGSLQALREICETFRVRHEPAELREARSLLRSEAAAGAS